MGEAFTRVLCCGVSTVSYLAYRAAHLHPCLLILRCIARVEQGLVIPERLIGGLDTIFERSPWTWKPCRQLSFSDAVLQEQLEECATTGLALGAECCTLSDVRCGQMGGSVSLGRSRGRLCASAALGLLLHLDPNTGGAFAVTKLEEQCHYVQAEG